MPINLINWSLALSPILLVLVLMIGFRWSGSKSGACCWLVTAALALLRFGASFELIAFTQAKAILLSLDVLYIIWTALLFYYVVEEAGAVGDIGKSLPALSADRVMQGLILGWLFASFLQGMGGFGVPVAVAAPLLVGMGFSPVQAVVMACIGHGWAVNFGSMATSFQTLMAVTNLPGELLAPESALLLGISSFPCGAIVAFIAGGWKGLYRNLPQILLLSTVMGSAQYLLTTHGIWTLGASGGAMAGLAVALLLARLPRRQGDDPNMAIEALPSRRRILISLSAYAALIVLAFGLNLIPALNHLADSVQLSLRFPELTTTLGWTTPAERGRSINLFGHPGAILIYASALSFAIFKAAGRYTQGATGRIGQSVLRSAVNSSLGIIAMVGLAVIMSNTGMTSLLAEGVSRVVNRDYYPFVAPFLGALGAFITGSNNNSNVLFALLQMRTAELLGLSTTLILAAQTAGGSLGSVLAPAKVIVGCSTVGLGDNESKVMGPVLAYGILPILTIALLATIMALR